MTLEIADDKTILTSADLSLFLFSEVKDELSSPTPEATSVETEGTRSTDEDCAIVNSADLVLCSFISAFFFFFFLQFSAELTQHHTWTKKCFSDPAGCLVWLLKIAHHPEVNASTVALVDPGVEEAPSHSKRGGKRME